MGSTLDIEAQLPGLADLETPGDPLEQARIRYSEFLDLCRAEEGFHRLTPAADPSAFATCFWIFGMHLIRRDEVLADQRMELSRLIRHAVRDARTTSAAKGRLQAKSYRQLLAFSLSALTVLGTLPEDPLEDLVTEQLPESVGRDLESLGCLSGLAQSGNQAMFLAIYLLYARDSLGIPTDDRIQEWVRCHLAAINRFGFWGSFRGMTALQFQNGYHQYEILEYLRVQTGKEKIAANSVARLADRQGHFAPYPGGGGCFDYDAVFILTPADGIPEPGIVALLQRTTTTLLSEQQPDGGFCESLLVRPRKPTNVIKSIGHVLDTLPNPQATVERLRYAVALQRRRYDRIETHWSKYSREWNESDLWDSWFRMLALARIQCAVDKRAAGQWGFIDFPGIGFHPSLRGGD